MKFPVALHRDEGSVYGVTVPDIPGCHSWGETADEALENAREAIGSHIEVLLDLGEPVDFHPSRIEDLLGTEGFADVLMWGVVEIDPALLDSTPERVNISLPRALLRRIDRYTRAHHETRSGFLARSALRTLSET